MIISKLKLFLLEPVLVIAVVFLSVTNAKAQVESSDSLLVKKYLYAVQSGQREIIRDFIIENYDSTFIKRIPLEHHVSMQMQYFYSGGGAGYEFKKIISHAGSEIKSLLLNKFTGAWIILKVPVNKYLPGKINDFAEFRIVATPEGYEKSERKSDEKIVNNLEKCLSLMVNNDDFSGAVLFAKNGEPLFKKAFGLANKSDQIPNQLNTKFNIASVGKMFTGIAIAQLVEKGKLSYNDTINKYISADWMNPEFSKKIQIKHLLTHTSGLGDYFSRLAKPYDKFIFRNLDDYKVLTATETMSSEPGTKWSYSNTGMLLLGVIIEKVSGFEYFEYLQKNIFDAAGMINTGAFEKDRPVPNRSLGYIKEYLNGKVNWIDNSISRIAKGSPSGGWYSTVEDLLNFDSALRFYKLLSKESTKVIQSAKPEINSPFYGYGFFIGNCGIGKIARHGGDGIGINAQFSIYLDAGYTVIVLSNYNRPAAEIIDNVLYQMLSSL